MRSNLKRGKLRPPASLHAARQRLRQLSFEIRRIEQQLADVTRPLRARSVREYEDWCRHASGALTIFREEEWQLSRWVLDQEGDIVQLLREARALLNRLVEEDVEFDPDELEVVSKIDALFVARGEVDGVVALASKRTA